MYFNIHIMDIAEEIEFSIILKRLTSENRGCLLDCARLCRIAEQTARKAGGKRTGGRLHTETIRTLNTKEKYG
jgi:hypothetical protein